MTITDRPLRLGLVGPCGAGKTTIKNLLANLPIEVRHIAQEHSYTPAMWQKIARPDVLVFLDASYPVTKARRRLNWTEEEYNEQGRRLMHARTNCHLYIQTDSLTPEQVAAQIIQFLNQQGYLSGSG